MEKPANVTGPRDRSTINMSEGFDMRYWSSELGVSVEQLKAIVSKVGSKTEDVRKALADGPARPWRA